MPAVWVVATYLMSVRADRARVMQDANFARAFALYNADASRAYANREWNWAVKQARDNRDEN